MPTGQAHGSIGLTIQRARFYFRLGDRDALLADGKAGLALGETLADDTIIAHSLLNISYYHEGTFMEANLNRLKRALALAEATGDLELLARTNNSLGIIHANADDIVSSNQHYERAQQHYEARGDLLGISRVLYNRALNYEEK